MRSPGTQPSCLLETVHYLDPARWILWLTAGEKPYPAVCQPSGLENENFAGAYERPVTCFDIKTINPHTWLFKGLRREQGWDALRGKKGAVRILAEDQIVEKNPGKPLSRVISRGSLKLSNLLSLLQIPKAVLLDNIYSACFLSLCNFYQNSKNTIKLRQRSLLSLIGWIFIWSKQ